MISQIWKFPLLPNGAEIEMPIGAIILTVQTQAENPCIWAIVNPQNEKEKRHFVLVPTGENFWFSEEGKHIYINTFQLSKGALVYHLFERIN